MKKNLVAEEEGFEPSHQNYPAYSLSRTASYSLLSTLPFGAPGEIRTHTLQILSLLPLPLGYRGIKMVGLERFELSRLATLDPKSSVSAVPPQPQMRVFLSLGGRPFHPP